MGAKSASFPPLEVWPFKSSYWDWGALYAPPAGFVAEPQKKSKIDFGAF